MIFLAKVARRGNTRGRGKSKRVGRSILRGVAVGEYSFSGGHRTQARIAISQFVSLAKKYFLDKKIPERARKDAENVLTVVWPILSGEATIGERAKEFGLKADEVVALVDLAHREVIPTIREYVPKK